MPFWAKARAHLTKIQCDSMRSPVKPWKKTTPGTLALLGRWTMPRSHLPERLGNCTRDSINGSELPSFGKLPGSNACVRHIGRYDFSMLVPVL